MESDKLLITFGDGNTSEALQVLSERYIKISGLSILRAKAIQDTLSFIIFDDIVNAIDDDHRNGVAELLMKFDRPDVKIVLEHLEKLDDLVRNTKTEHTANVSSL